MILPRKPKLVIHEGIPSAVKGWLAFLGLVLIELWLLYVIPPTILSDVPLLRWFVDAVARIAPSIHNLDRISPYPQKINFYMALTLVLMIPKAAFIYWWLNSSYMNTYRHLVISPLTASRPAHGGEFVTAPLHEEQAPGPQKPRSTFSRIVWSLAILVLPAIPLAYMLHGFGSRGAEHDVKALDLATLELATGGLRFWLEWTVAIVSLSSFLLAIALCVLRDYIVWIGRKLRG
ncbi:MAG: hypothetical protein ACREQL_06860 [Candidatus Binatia bacterium]